MTEELKKKAEEYVSTMGYNTYESDGHDDYSVKDALVEFANEVTKKLQKQIEKMKQALIDIKTNTDDVNIEWQIHYLFEELGIKEEI